MLHTLLKAKSSKPELGLVVERIKVIDICEMRSWGDIQVGDLIFLRENETSPCDMILLDS
jgi:magnesium-transporting ATPase (P-type)